MGQYRNVFNTNYAFLVQNFTEQNALQLLYSFNTASKFSQ